VRWTLIVAPLAWTPLAIVALDCAGVDAWVVPGPAWLAANLAFGVVMLAGGWWLSVQYAARWAGSPRLRRLTDALSGRGVADAAAALRRVAEFEVEA
jgi:hypothetical protein